MITQEQWQELYRTSLDTPESRLHQALILDAIACLGKLRATEGREARREMQEIIDWIRDLDGERNRYPIRFRDAVDRAFSRIDADALSQTLVTRFPPRCVIRKNFVDHGR